MKLKQKNEQKIYDKESLSNQLIKWRTERKKIVFTNGVFDIIHKGHLELLSKTSSLADVLIVGLNSDESVKRLKGNDRPVNDEHFRALLLASLNITDAVIIFGEDTPAEIIKLIKPDVLVKGGDYNTDNIVGAKDVMEAGGEVIIIDLVKGLSTTATISRIKNMR